MTIMHFLGALCCLAVIRVVTLRDTKPCELVLGQVCITHSYSFFEKSHRFVMNRTCFDFPTTPPGQPVWVANASCRGTFEIVSLCLSTTFICIWSSVHRDIPLTRLPSSFRSFLRSAPLVLVALFAPELLFYFALNQYLAARGLVTTTSELGSFKEPLKDQGGDGALKPWRTQLLELMQISERSGERQQRRDDNTELLRCTSQNEAIYRQHAFTLTHGFYATMGGFIFFALEEDGSVGNRPIKLTSNGVRFLMKHAPDLIPDLSLTSITDRSKSSSLGKALLFVQVVWFCISCVTRLGERLPLSLLEVSTLAHGIFTLSSYAMWWQKPLNIDEPTLILPPHGADQCERVREILALLQIFNTDSVLQSELEQEERDNLYSTILDYYDGAGVDGFPRRRLGSKRLELAVSAAKRYGISPSDVLGGNYSTWHTVPTFKRLFGATGLTNSVADYAVMTCIPLIYGLLHFLGWHAQFPSTTERRLWRYATIIIMSSGASRSFFDWLDLIGRKGWLCESLRKVVGATHKTVMYFMLPIPYVAASMYLLGESVRQLWYVPHEAYVDGAWSYYIPHWL